MKKLINALAIWMLAILGVTTFNSCDTCGSTICNHGTCSNGTCVCTPNSGYEKRGTGCVGVNVDYISVDSAFTTTITRVDSNGTTYPPLINVAYEVIPSSISPYVFTLNKFNGLNGNDISFTITSNNYSLLVPQTVVTSTLNTYTISGSKNGSIIVLTIIDLASDITYTLTYA